MLVQEIPKREADKKKLETGVLHGKCLFELLNSCMDKKMVSKQLMDF